MTNLVQETIYLIGVVLFTLDSFGISIVTNEIQGKKWSTFITTHKNGLKKIKRVILKKDPKKKIPR